MFNWFRKYEKEIEKINQCTMTNEVIPLTAAEAKQLSDVKHNIKVNQFADCWEIKAHQAILIAVEQGLYYVEVSCPATREFTMEDLMLTASIAQEFKKKMVKLGYNVTFDSTLYINARISWEKGGV